MRAMKNLYPDLRSIRAVLKESYRTIILVMLCPTLAVLVAVVIMVSQYNQKINNINTASIIQSELEKPINEDLWHIASGQKQEAVESYDWILDKTQKRLETLYQESQSDTAALSYVQAAQRAFDTLRQYTLRLNEQIITQAPATENEWLYREIKSVEGMIDRMMQQYIKEEIDVIAVQNQNIIRVFIMIAAVIVMVLLFMIGFSIMTYNNVMVNVIGPIQNMENMTDSVREGDLTARVEITDVEELSRLCESLNLMVRKIGDLIAEQVQAQKELQKSELRILQEQITPHFVYNTMDTIIWLAEVGRTKDVIKITMAFSDFFRISLSRGQEFVSVREEVRHIERYIEIQKVRYAKFLTSDICIDPSIMGCKVLKLVLQPLVENAIYHGIKGRRGQGHISVMGVKTINEDIMFMVEDDGVGIKPEVLKRIQQVLQEDAISDDIGVGLYNVNRRLRLYYGIDGLQITSSYGSGTMVSFVIPQQRGDGTD